MRAELHRTFIKDFKRQPYKIRERFVERKNLFLKYPMMAILKNHELHGKFSGCRSINITGDIRAIFYLQEDTALFIHIGTHAELYK